MAEQAAEVLDSGNQEEPSMEEILASIRKIITEEEEAPAAATTEGATAPAEEEDVIDLTEGELISPAAEAAIETYEAPGELTAAAPAIVEPEPEQIIAAAEPIVVPEIVAEPKATFDEPRQAIEVAPVQAQVAEPSDPEIDLIEEPALLSEKSAEVAGKAFHDLALKINLLGNKENTLEGVVKELLRPMLKEWLDENLPRMVLKLVRKEIEKITQ